MRELILKLRGTGKSYTEIANIVGCAKSTVCYYVATNQRQKHTQRQRRNRQKQHPFVKKLSKFCGEKCSQQPPQIVLSSVRKLVYNKLWNFTNDYKYNIESVPMITLEQILIKFGNEPKCYLTGQAIDINQPKTYEFDHIIPRSRGGDNSLSNLGLATKLANRAKGNMTVDEFINLCQQVVQNNGGESNP